LDGKPKGYLFKLTWVNYSSTAVIIVITILADELPALSLLIRPVLAVDLFVSPTPSSTNPASRIARIISIIFINFFTNTHSLSSLVAFSKALLEY